jgi:hypothetical protein
VRLQLMQRTLDRRHGDLAAAGRALPTHFDGDRFNRVSRTHAAQSAPNRL